MGVEIVDSIPKLLEKVDVVLLESVDGRIHLEEAIPVFKAGKPLFIDKPVAGSLADAIAIFELAKKHNVPCFSSSSLRFSAGIQALLKQSEEVGDDRRRRRLGGSCSTQTGTPDLFFYGIHGVEPLFTLMGTGCETVTRVADQGRRRRHRRLERRPRSAPFAAFARGKASSGAVVFGSEADRPGRKAWQRYEDLCREIGKFFKTGKPPVSAEETIEIFAFMEAADESKRQGGAPVVVADVLAKAKAEAAAKLKD